MEVEGSFLCNNCNYQTNSSSNLDKHILLAHTPKIAKKCDSCDKIFPENNAFRKHILKTKKITNPSKTSEMIQMVVNLSKDVTSVMFQFLQISTDVIDVVVNLIQLPL